MTGAFQPPPPDMTVSAVRADTEAGYSVRIPLRSDFRFVHEPITGATPDRFVGRQREIDGLVRRLLRSDGGSFLVTGYRGVGKTSFINRVVEQLKQEFPAAAGAPAHVLDVQLNLARPLPPVDLMFHIIRCLHSRLRELKLEQYLGEEIRQELALAFARTSMNIVAKNALALEGSLGLPEIQLGTGPAAARFKTPGSLKRTSSRERQLTYMPYDERAAEYDLIRLARLLARGVEARPPRWQFWRKPQFIRLKIVFVFDELDKLEEPVVEGKRPYLDDLFSSLKNLFTTSGICFLFVAGKDLQERWREDVGRGDSIYESIFAYERYLPILWEGEDSICREFIPSGNGDGASSAERATFERYLGYVGRGIPRRIIRTLNDFVRWSGNDPVLAFTAREFQQVRFYADLETVLRASGLRRVVEAGADETDLDKRRLAVYYLIDWILHRGRRPFTAIEVIAFWRQLSPKLIVSEDVESVVERLFAALAESSYIEAAQNLGEAQVVNAAEKVNRYRLTEEALAGLGGTQALPKDAAPGHKPVEPGSVFGDYQIVRQVGAGATGTVYKAWDRRRARTVALKVLHAHVDPLFARSFESEARALGELRHEHIPEIYDWGEHDGRHFIAMEFIEGLSLEKLLQEKHMLPERTAVSIILSVVDTLAFVHSHGYIRNDIKPANLRIDVNGKVYLMDFGTSRKNLSSSTQQVGTPLYMAPEQFLGNDSGALSEIYALGLILYEMVCGRRPCESDDLQKLLEMRLAGAFQAPTTFGVAAPLSAVIERCLAREPEQRYPGMSELERALKDLGLPVGTAELQADLPKWVDRAAAPAETVVEHTQVFTPIVEAPAPPPPAPVPAPPPPPAPVPAAPPPPAPVPAAPPPPAQPASAASTVRFSDLPPSVAHVHVTYRNTGQSMVFVLSKDESRIGRSGNVEITLEDPSVSRVQGKIVRKGDQYFFFDFNSLNGTFINGNSIQRKTHVPLRDGDEITFGPYAMTFQYSGGVPAASVKP